MCAWSFPAEYINGVVVLESKTALLEEAAVIVTYSVPSKSPAEKWRIAVPLVRTDQASSVQLTGERIAEILDEN